MRCSETGQPVAGCIGSLHPIGKPIIQSEKLGLKIRSPVEDLCPDIKLKWSGREERKLGRPVGRAFHARVRSQICVHCRVEFLSAI